MVRWLLPMRANETTHRSMKGGWTIAGRSAFHAPMKMLSLLCGLLLLGGTFVWFFYFVPLGCGMNPTGCREEFSVWSQIGLLHFWSPLAVSAAAIIYGSTRR